MPNHALVSNDRLLALAVYLMDEVAELARSTPDTAEKVADRIAKRLQAKNANTKYKAGTASSLLQRPLVP